jgi:hypothetical protein
MFSLAGQESGKPGDTLLGGVPSFCSYHSVGGPGIQLLIPS